MQVAGGTALVVERAGAGALLQGAEGPLVEGVVEAAVADVARQHGAFSARRDGQWGGSGVVLATLGGGVAVRVVPELTEHPGAEDDTKSWQGAVDVGVRVCLKMCRQFGFEVGDLTVQLDDDADRGPGGRGECGGDCGGGGELLGAQRSGDLLGADI